MLASANQLKHTTQKTIIFRREILCLERKRFVHERQNVFMARNYGMASTETRSIITFTSAQS